MFTIYDFCALCFKKSINKYFKAVAVPSFFQILKKGGKLNESVFVK